MNGRVDADLLIIGAGLAGAATAWAATKRGLSVVVFEQFAIGHDRGSSHGSARIFRRAYPDELYVRLTGEAGELWRELENDTGKELLRATGGLDHGPGRGVGLIDELLTSAGVPHELMGPEEAGERWPGMRFEGPVVYHPEAGVLDAAATVVACIEASRRRGATVLESTLVSAIALHDDGVTVRAGGQAWHARNAVVAAGAWVADVLRDVTGPPEPPGAPRVVVTQQQVSHFPRRDLSVAWPVFVHQGDLSIYGLPGGRDGGSSNGQKVAEHDNGKVTTASGRDGEVDPLARRRLVGYVEKWLPGLEPKPFNEATCLYTTTADEDFVLDQRGPLIVCSACSGHGAKFAPWLGVQAAALAAGEGRVLARFRLGRPSLASPL